MSVDLTPDLHGYFEVEVARALRNVGVPAAAATEAYLANLLTAAVDKVDELSTPLVELLAEALNVDASRRAPRMRRLGDAALVVSGFFGDSLPRRGVTHGYVTAIGVLAYKAAAHSDRSDVLNDLAQRFSAFARVVDEVREQTSMYTDADLLHLYERWVQTGSAEIHRRLARHGVTPSRVLLQE